MASRGFEYVQGMIVCEMGTHTVIEELMGVPLHYSMEAKRVTYV